MKRTISKRIKLEYDSFDCDQIVFVKLKGWPPWPAKITAINGLKCDVIYYGTNQT